MQIVGGKLTFSSGDLVGHLNCRYLTELDLKVAKGELAKPKTDEAAAMAPGNSLMQRRETQGGNPSLARPPHFLFLGLSFAFASGFWASA